MPSSPPKAAKSNGDIDQIAAGLASFFSGAVTEVHEGLD